jgi:hypothetical protein
MREINTIEMTSKVIKKELRYEKQLLIHDVSYVRGNVYTKIQK